ncbi:MAG: MBL fold metallo-hydrolase [Myxococcota bacterium]
MDWTCLGHAMWIAEVGETRLLFDPLLGEDHHGGVFRVQPLRRVHVEALRPDIIVVSHRHGDHFDVPSLHTLARAYPGATVLTADQHVGWAAEQLGFAEVEVLPVGHEVDLGEATLVTTPSVSPIEWGVMVGSAEGVVWNQIDSVIPTAERAGTIARALCGHLGAPGVTLSLSRWNPLLEIAAPLNRRTDFPRPDYGHILEQIVAVAPRCLVPSSVGGAHTAAFEWMDRYVYPVSEARFLDDLGVVAPDIEGLPHVTGGRYAVRGHRVAFDPTGGAELVTVEPTPDPRTFRPLAIPPLDDPNPEDRDEAEMRRVVNDWIVEALDPALRDAWPSFEVDRPLRFGVEVTWPSGPAGVTIVAGPTGSTCSEGLDPDWDTLNAVAGSMLAEVVEGRRHWGDVLLAGALRTANRTYRRRPGGLDAAKVPDTFLYLALPYATSEIRALRHAVTTALGRS